MARTASKRKQNRPQQHKKEDRIQNRQRLKQEEAHDNHNASGLNHSPDAEFPSLSHDTLSSRSFVRGFFQQELMGNLYDFTCVFV